MPSSGSNAPFQRPKNLVEFAALTNEIATRVLNNEISIDQARVFAALARVVSQSVSIRVQAARFLPGRNDVLELDTGEEQ